MPQRLRVRENLKPRKARRNFWIGEVEIDGKAIGVKAANKDSPRYDPNHVNVNTMMMMMSMNSGGGFYNNHPHQNMRGSFNAQGGYRTG